MAKIDKVLGPLGDWLRFSGGNWLIDTDRSSKDVFMALAEILRKGDSELIIRVDPADYAGWAAEWVDEWVAKKARRP